LRATSAEQTANRQAVRWKNGQIEKLATLAGHTASVAYGINEAGGMHAVRWTIAPVRERTAAR